MIDLSMVRFTKRVCNGVTLHVAEAGPDDGPPVLLLHGFPQSHVMWHRIAPGLAREHTVVAADLRGYGDSDRPEAGADHAGYAFRAMAADQAVGFSPRNSNSSSICA